MIGARDHIYFGIGIGGQPEWRPELSWVVLEEVDVREYAMPAGIPS